MDETEMIRFFSSLSPKAKRTALEKLQRSCVPTTYQSRWVPPGFDSTRLRDLAAFEVEKILNTQSEGFMIDMIPLMMPYLATLGHPRTVTALDVGSRTGAGAALLANQFHNAAMLRIAVDVIDISDMWRDYQIARWPSLRNAFAGNAFEIGEGKYDLVICSHTIEHINQPTSFARKLARLAREYAFFYCPYDEVNPIHGHHRVGDEIIDQLNPIGKEVVKSWWWRKGSLANDMQSCIFFVMPGVNRVS